MKYSKLIIPVAAMFVLAGCSPKVSNSVSSSSSETTSTYSGDGSALKASQEQQNAQVSMEMKENMQDVKPSNATPPAR